MFYSNCLLLFFTLIHQYYIGWSKINSALNLHYIKFIQHQSKDYGIKYADFIYFEVMNWSLVRFPKSCPYSQSVGKNNMADSGHQFLKRDIAVFCRHFLLYDRDIGSGLVDHTDILQGVANKFCYKPIDIHCNLTFSPNVM